MTEVTDVTIVAGKPTEGDGTVATISKLMGGKSISDLDTDLAAVNTILGATSGAKVVTDASGTIQQYLRGLVSMFAAGLSLTGSIAIAAGSAIIGKVVPVFNSWGVLNLQSNATGTTYNTFGSQACNQLTIINDTGVDLEFRAGGAGSTFIIWAYTTITIAGLANANEVGYRRKDTNNAQVNVAAVWNS